MEGPKLVLPVHMKKEYSTQLGDDISHLPAAVRVIISWDAVERSSSQL
jgi:hypothetical protein